MSRDADRGARRDDGPQNREAAGAAGDDFELDEAQAGAEAGRTGARPRKPEETPSFEDPNDR